MEIEVWEKWGMEEDDFVLGRVFDVVDEKMLSNKEFVLDALQYGPRNIYAIDKDLLKDKDVIKSILFDGDAPTHALSFVSKEMLEDYEIRNRVYAYFVTNPKSIVHIVHRDVLEDREMMFNILKNNDEIVGSFYMLPKSLRFDKEFVLASMRAVKKNNPNLFNSGFSIYNNTSEELKYDLDVVEAIGFKDYKTFMKIAEYVEFIDDIEKSEFGYNLNIKRSDLVRMIKKIEHKNKSRSR